MTQGGHELSTRALGFSYRPGAPLLDGLDLSFPGGSVTAITGASGSGKSTLLHVLGLMVRPTRGEVVLDGERVDAGSDADRADLRADVYGFVFQDALLDATRTTLDNALETSLYRGARRFEERMRAMALLEQFGVSERALHRPGQISGGQAQRIALCRALLGNPAVLLADEPTGNLDAGSGRVVVDALRDHARTGAIVIVATHDPRVVDQCDHVVEIT